MIQVFNCAFNFTPALTLVACGLQNVAALSGAMVWFWALFEFNDEFNNLCDSPLETLIHLNYGISWQLALTVFFVSFISLLMVEDAMNWQRILPSWGYRYPLPSPWRY